VQVQQMPQSSQDMRGRRMMPSSFLDITPDVMTKEIWESLSTEQQTQWQGKYPPR
jgi:hypothetical protein